MQVSYFTTGGFVIHKIPYGAGKLSAWFGADGELKDIEKYYEIISKGLLSQQYED